MEELRFSNGSVIKRVKGGITITAVKIVGNCSKHGEKMRNKFGEEYTDDVIECIECNF